MEDILGYDCDGTAIEEFRILRTPFSTEVDNWDEVPNVDPRFYCAVRGSNRKSYLISVYHDYFTDAIKKYEKTDKILTKVKSIHKSINYEVAFDGITGQEWFYERDRGILKEKLELFIKIKEQKDIDEER